MSIRPHFKEYVIARLITIAVAIFILFSILLLLFVSQRDVAFMAIGLLALAFSFLIFMIYRGANRMQNELNMINKYLSNLDKIDKIDYKTHFFTHELEEINQNLIKVLKKSKKREDNKQRYNAKLKLKNRQRADMLSAIAHEFRNPIASIMGYAQTLQEDKDIPQNTQEQFLHKIYNNGNKIESLLSRLVLWNKFESKEAELHRSTFDLHALVKEVIVSLEESYSDRNIIFTGENRDIHADRTLIEVLLRNLIENALKYSKEIVVVHSDVSYLYVTDKGIGIEKEEIENVTKKFYRSDIHTWNNSMGLGLAIAKSILTLHKTKLEIKSIKNEGSTFYFKI